VGGFSPRYRVAGPIHALALRMGSRPLVVYDGNCAFCKRQVDRLRSWDKRDRFDYLPHTAPGIEERYPALRASGAAGMDIERGMILLTPDGETHIGADAVQQIMRRLPPLNLLAPMFHVPGVRRLARRLYGWIARRRYRLSGQCEGEACRLDKPGEERARG
jgi:predicted DCC family thiol-disulfide oxidoreductase YuxK